MTRAPLAVAALALATLAGAGCHSPVTEVVLVVDSDIAVPTEADTIQILGDFVTSNGPGASQGGPLPLSGFPVSFGFVASDDVESQFSVTIELDRSRVPTTQPIVLRRSTTDIEFVRQETRMLVVTLSKACACQGTSCPNPGDPACDDIMSPDTEPFDPARAPPSTPGSQVFTLGGPDAGSIPTRPPIDAGSGVFVVDAGPRDAVTRPDLGATDLGQPDGVRPDGNPADGSFDGTAADTTSREGGSPDGGAPDGGSADGALPEAGGLEAGSADGGAGEAGVD